MLKFFDKIADEYIKRKEEGDIMKEITEKSKVIKKWVSTDKYKENYDRIFKKKNDKKENKENGEKDEKFVGKDNQSL